MEYNKIVLAYLAWLVFVSSASKTNHVALKTDNPYLLALFLAVHE